MRQGILLLFGAFFAMNCFAANKKEDSQYKKENLSKMIAHDDAVHAKIWEKMIKIGIEYKDSDIYSQAIKQLDRADGAGASNLYMDLFYLFEGDGKLFLQELYKKKEYVQKISHAWVGESSDVDFSKFKEALNKTQSKFLKDFLRELSKNDLFGVLKEVYKKHGIKYESSIQIENSK